MSVAEDVRALNQAANYVTALDQLLRERVHQLGHSSIEVAHRRGLYKFMITS